MVASCPGAAAAKARKNTAVALWFATLYWVSKVTGVLVADTVKSTAGTDHRRLTLHAANKPTWLWMRAWNATCMAAVVYRVYTETWAMTVQAVGLPDASCYDLVCGGVWCVYACAYYSVAWLDRISEAGTLTLAVWWRLRSTVEGLNSAAVAAERLACDRDEDDDFDQDHGGTAASAAASWRAYVPMLLIPSVQFAVSLRSQVSLAAGMWRLLINVATATASCAPVVSHGMAVAQLLVAENNMRYINRRIVAHLDARRRDQGVSIDVERDRSIVTRLARRHWRTTELVTADETGVCGAYSLDMLIAVILAVVRIIYISIAVLHQLTDASDAEKTYRAQHNLDSLLFGLAVVTQLVAWFGQFAYLTFTCDGLAAQSSAMYDNLNALLLDNFKHHRFTEGTHLNKLHEIEAVQEFMRQVVTRKVNVHACAGLITLNLSLITTILGVTLTYFIVLLEFESSHGSTYIRYSNITE